MHIETTSEARVYPPNEATVSNGDDFANDYEYCMVLNGGKYAEDFDDDGKAYIGVLLQNGLDLFAFTGSKKTEIFVLIRAPMEKLKEFCDKLDYNLLLDSKKLEEIASKGFPDRKIAPISIAHNSTETHIPPYEHIFGPYRLDIPEDLYWRPQDKSHPFREILRYKVTYSMIEAKPPSGGEHLKIRRYIKKGTVKAFFPLHKPTKRSQLLKEWVGCTPIPNRNLIDQMKNYFGEKIGLYFAFICHYATWLTIPAIIGIIFQVVVVSTGDFSSPVLPPFSAFICLWAIFMLEYWKRQERYIALQWGMVGFESSDKDRPEFRGELAKSYINGREFKYYPSKKRKTLVTTTSSIVLTLMMSVVAAIVIIYVLKYYRYISQTVASILNAIQINIFNVVYSYLVDVLTDWENHRTDTAYEDGLISKLFLFQFVNSYASFFYLAFIAPFIGECGGSETSCMQSLAVNLAIIFGVNITVGNFTELFLPYLSFRMKLRAEKIAIKDYYNLPRPEQEFFCNEYHGIKGSLENYAEIAIQFGFMVLFITCLPAAAAFGLVFNLVELKLDGWKLFTLSQRPVPRGTEDIGIWQLFLSLTSVAAVLTNAGLIAFTMDVLVIFESVHRLWIFFGFVLFCFGAQFGLSVLIPDEPVEVDIQLKRTEFLVDKIINKVEDDVVVGNQRVQSSSSIPIQSYPK